MKRAWGLMLFVAGSLFGVLLDRTFGHYYGDQFEQTLKTYPTPGDGAMDLAKFVALWLASDEGIFWLALALIGGGALSMLRHSSSRPEFQRSNAIRMQRYFTIAQLSALAGAVVGGAVRLLVGYGGTPVDAAMITTLALTSVGLLVFACAFVWGMTLDWKWYDAGNSSQYHLGPPPTKKQLDDARLAASQLADLEALAHLRDFGMSGRYARHTLGRIRAGRWSPPGVSKDVASGEGEPDARVDPPGSPAQGERK